MTSPQVWHPPIRMYHSQDHLCVAAPMPGMEPEDISVTITGNLLIIRGEQRGARQDERDLLVAEWVIGPYYREVDLPIPVNGALTNATYGNGVLVVSMPKVQPGQKGTDGSFQLDAITATRGEHVGHAGREMRPVSTAEHLAHHIHAARAPSDSSGLAR